MAEVWILKEGWEYEGYDIVDVYSRLAVAYGDFVEKVTRLDYWGGNPVDHWGGEAAFRKEPEHSLWKTEDGSFYAQVRDHWVGLTLHQVRTRPKAGR